MKQIELTKNKFALVDNEDFDKIIKEFMDRTRDMSPIQKVGEVKQFLKDYMTSEYDGVHKLSFRYGASNMDKELADGKYDLPKLSSKSKIANVNNDVVKLDNVEEKEAPLAEDNAGKVAMAREYLLTGGLNSMLSSDYFLQALIGSFIKASDKISLISIILYSEFSNAFSDFSF